MNPKKLKWFEKAFKLKQDIIDERMWLQGAYIENAFAVVLSNAFAKKGAKANKYIDKPFSRMENNKTELTEEEKLQQVQNLFTMLSVRKTNFDLEKGNTK